MTKLDCISICILENITHDFAYDIDSYKMTEMHSVKGYILMLC